MPTYNEVKNVRRVIPVLLDALERERWDAVVLVVDDASPDGTADAAEELGRETGRVRVLRRPGKLGLGSAYRDGFQLALKEMSWAEYICEMDADGSHPPEILPLMLSLAEREDADVVVASRYVEGGGWEHGPLTRRIISRGANLLARIATGIGVSDLTSGFRVIRAEALRRIVDKLRELHSGYVFQVELLYHFHCLGAKIIEYPFTFKPRISGESKLGKEEIVSYARWCLKTFLGRAGL